MSELERSPGISRRTLVKGVGLAVGSILTAPPWAWLSNAQTSGRIKIGVLLPHSKLHPLLPVSMLAGMRFGLDQMRLQTGEPGAELIVGSISPQGSRAVAQSEKLIYRDKADVVVGVISESVAANLRELFNRAKVPLVVSGAGANVIRRNEQGPFICHASLDFWQASWAMGAWAASNPGSKAFMVTSLYDSGYDAHWAFRNGFEESGGEVQESFVTHSSSSLTDLVSVMDRIAQIKPDFVYASYCGKAAVDFVKAYADAGWAGKIPLLGSSFLADEAILPIHGEAGRGIKTCLPWSCDLDTPANKLFTAAYLRQTGHRPDVFGLLGYDTARLIGKAWKAAGGNGHGKTLFEEALAAAECASPRGRVRMKPHAHRTDVPLYLAEVRYRDGIWCNDVIAELDPISEHHPSIQSIRSTRRSGWISPYLFV